MGDSGCEYNTRPHRPMERPLFRSFGLTPHIWQFGLYAVYCMRMHPHMQWSIMFGLMPKWVTMLRSLLLEGDYSRHFPSWKWTGLPSKLPSLCFGVTSWGFSIILFVTEYELLCLILTLLLTSFVYSIHANSVISSSYFSQYPSSDRWF